MTDDLVNHPLYYITAGGVECFDVVHQLPYSLGTALAYIWRAPYKGHEQQDKAKAWWYFQAYSQELARTAALRYDQSGDGPDPTYGQLEAVFREHVRRARRYVPAPEWVRAVSIAAADMAKADGGEQRANIFEALCGSNWDAFGASMRAYLHPQG